MQKIVPFLWFKDNAEEAMNFYTSTFPNSRVISSARYPEGAPMPAGTLMTCSVEVSGSPMILLNGGPYEDANFNHGISLSVSCDTQEEIDSLWESFDGGTAEQCGWIRDKFGVVWQIVPTMMDTLWTDATPEQAQRIMAVMMNMVKLDIAALQAAKDGN